MYSRTQQWPETPLPVGQEHVFLVGRPPFEEYLSFMSSEPIGGEEADMSSLAQEWRDANDHIKTLRDSEKEWADNPPIGAIPAQSQGLVSKVLSDPFFKKAFYAVPVELGLVELDRLVVFQKSINLAYVEQLKQKLGPKPTEEEVFRLCMPFDHSAVNHHSRRIAQNAFSFVSVSNDLRVQDFAILRPDQIPNHDSTGPVAGIVAVFVGYGPNYLSVVSAEGRLILNNASHRAYALRDLGVTHAPCVIQRVTRREDLNVVAGMNCPLAQNPDTYLKEPRPPVLKDYFDPKLRKVVRLAPKARQIRIGIGAETSDIPWGSGL
jgi:hypothetical protein